MWGVVKLTAGFQLPLVPVSFHHPERDGGGRELGGERERTSEREREMVRDGETEAERVVGGAGFRRGPAAKAGPLHGDAM